MKFLNSKEVKKIMHSLKEQFGFNGNLDYVFVQTDKDKVYVVTKDINKVDMPKLRINSIGLYIAELTGEGLRLSIEGSQLVGPKATKNVVELDDEELKEWIKGYDVWKKVDGSGFAVIKHGNDFIGCGKVNNGKILNYVPKARRLMVVD